MGYLAVFRKSDTETGENRKLSYWFCLPFGFAPCTRDRNPYALPWIKGHEHFDQTIDREPAEISIAHAGKISGGEWGPLTRFRSRQLLSVHHADNRSGEVGFGLTDLGIGETGILPKIAASTDQF